MKVKFLINFFDRCFSAKFSVLKNNRYNAETISILCKYVYLKPPNIAFFLVVHA